MASYISNIHTYDDTSYNIYIYILCTYIEYDMTHLVCVMCGMQSMLCAGFSLSHVRDLVCVMYGILSVLCTGFSLSYVRDFVCVM